MLVRISTMLLLRNPFPSQPITLVQTPSRSNSLVDEQIISPNTTTRSVNISSVHTSSEYGIVTDTTSTTIGVPSTLLLQQDLYNPEDRPASFHSIDRSCAENDTKKSEESIIQDHVDLKSGDTFCPSQIPISGVQERKEDSVQQKGKEKVKEPVRLEPVIAQMEELVQVVEEPVQIEEPVQVDELVQVEEIVKIEEPMQVEEPVQMKDIELEQVKEPEQAMETEQVNEPEQVNVPEQVNEKSKESEQETIVLDITQRRTSYVPETTLADITETEELDISKYETLEITDNKVSKKQGEPMRSTLLEKSISSAYPRTQLLDQAITPAYESVDDEGVIYYKRREDLHSKIEPLTPSASTTTQRKRYSLYAALGTRIHPRSSLDDSKGMPVFQTPAPTAADKLKPKTMLKRFKTIVKNKKKSTTL